jgi:hypothetical protein
MEHNSQIQHPHIEEEYVTKFEHGSMQVFIVTKFEHGSMQVFMNNILTTDQFLFL